MILGKSQNCMGIQPSVQCPQRKSRYQSFHVLFNFVLFLNFSQHILHRIAYTPLVL